MLDEAKAAKERQAKFAKLLVKLEEKIAGSSPTFDDQHLRLLDTEDDLAELEVLLADKDKRRNIVCSVTRFIFLCYFK